ncbi:MAG: PfkB family carbohydrate kinase, partial [Candidatus Eremiobacterota bacterium]
MFAVIGHVEWVEFVRVERVPRPGEIVHATEWFEEPAGGGAVAAVQLLKLTGDTVFFTALGDDELGHRACEQLRAMGLRMEVAWRPTPQRRGVTFLDAHGERTITVMGERLGASAKDPLAWDLLDRCRGVYFTA